LAREHFFKTTKEPVRVNWLFCCFEKVAAVWIEHTTQGLSVDVVSYPFNRALANLDFPLQIA